MPSISLKKLLLLVFVFFLGFSLLIFNLSVVQSAGLLHRITIASDSSRDSTSPHFSGDGQKIAFRSDSDFLGQGIQNDQYEIWLYDVETLSFTRISTATDSDCVSRSFDLSTSGTKIAFESDSDFLSQGIPPGQFEIWLFDTVTMTYTRITTATDSNRNSSQPALNADGTKIAFVSNIDFLNEGIPYYIFEVWLYDTISMTYTRITTASESNRRSVYPTLNADGTKIAFSSNSDWLNLGIPYNQNEVWLYDFTTTAFTRVTTTTSDSWGSVYPSISADGGRIAFYSDSDFFNQGISRGQYEVWLYDTQTITLTRITTASHTDRASAYPKLSADGTKIVFYSDSDFFGQGIQNDQYEVWLYDIATKELSRITTASASNRSSYFPSLNADGTKIVFNSNSDFFHQGHPIGQIEIWMVSEAAHQMYLPIIFKY